MQSCRKSASRISLLGHADITFYPFCLSQIGHSKQLFLSVSETDTAVRQTVLAGQC